MVLISPLWASIRNGWAKLQIGWVLVEKRWWKVTALLESSLRSLETYALTARSATSEEASLRQNEGDQILKFVERARRAQPRGQVILAQSAGAGETLLMPANVPHAVTPLEPFKMVLVMLRSPADAAK